MKLKELLDGYEIFNKDKLNCPELDVYSKDREILLLNYFKDCVVAYNKSPLGILFIIKGKIKPFFFFAINKKLKTLFFNNRIVRRIELNSSMFRDLIQNNIQNFTILEEDYFNKIKKKMLVESL